MYEDHKIHKDVAKKRYQTPALPILCELHFPIRDITSGKFSAG